MVSAESSYATEVASAKQRIKILKNRLARRTAARQGLAAGNQPRSQAGQGAGEGAEAITAAAEAAAILKSLIASHLLSLDATQLPTDSQSIHKKVLFLGVGGFAEVAQQLSTLNWQTLFCSLPRVTRQQRWKMHWRNQDIPACNLCLRTWQMASASPSTRTLMRRSRDCG